MNILVTLNSGYVNPLCVMLRSLTQSNPRTVFDIYVANTDLTETDFDTIGKAVEGSGSRVISVRVSAELFRDAPILKRTAKETYYRLFAAAYLPKDLDRILYIDPDTLILGNLAPLYNVQFGDCFFAGCGHLTSFANFVNVARLGMHPKSAYINAGVLMMNLRALRAFFSPEEVFACIRQHPHSLFLADQDVLNALYGERILRLDENIYNLDERCFRRLVKRYGKAAAMELVRQNTCILHYNGKYKPWREAYKGDLDCFYPVRARQTAVQRYAQ